jgi:biopolymer transport protein ExbD
LSVQLALLFLLMAGIAPEHAKWSNDLPHAQNAKLQPGARWEDAMRFGVLRDGKIYFRENQIATEELASLLRTAIQEGSERKVYLRWTQEPLTATRSASSTKFGSGASLMSRL